METAQNNHTQAFCHTMRPWHSPSFETRGELRAASASSRMEPTSARASLLHQPTVNLRPSISGGGALKEPLLKRFPDWHPIENPTYRFLDHDFYVERAKHFSTYDSNSWFSTLLLSVSPFSLTPAAVYILL